MAEKNRAKLSKLIISAVVAFVIIISSTVSASAVGENVLVGGDIFGVRLQSDGIIVDGFDKIISNGKKLCPAKEAGIKSGDRIITVNNIEISEAYEFAEQVENSLGQKLEIGLIRDNEKIKKSVLPVISDTDGLYKIGMKIRDSAAGIGTVTFVDPETLEFAGLGHGITVGDDNDLMIIKSGELESASVGSVEKSKNGHPGAIKGSFLGKKIGIVTSNTEVGIFGMLTDKPSGDIISIASKEEVYDGSAEILATLENGKKSLYSCEISDISPSTETRNFIVNITDGDLIEAAGGIVQGMSGSPIIQNGKLIGAVTHVLVDNPTKGYGIFVENMINGMPKLVK